MKSIDALALHKKMEEKEDFLLIDVREPAEHKAFNIGGILIPMNEVFDNLHMIPKDKTVVFYCQKGIRSGLVIQRLQQKYHYDNLLNLSGGMDGWQKTFK